MSTWVGIDVGGTFTDVVVYTNDGERMVTGKVPSTPDDPSRAFMNGLDLGLEKAGASAESVTRLVHGSTVGINAFLQRRGARVGVICTRGFEDTLAIGRAKRKQMYEFRLETQTPTFLADRSRTVGISSRLDREGQLVNRAEAGEIDEAIRFLVEEQKVESIALNLLFSYTDPSVEEAIAARILELHPDVFVSRSSEVDPRVREYERLVVTALDAYVRPLVSKYVATLRTQLANTGVTAKLFMMESHGGIVDAELLDGKAVSVLMSGLAGGAIGAAKVGTVLSQPNLLSVDMGGTSTDVTLITGEEVALSDEGVIGNFDVRLPAVDVHTVGAGGGSIAEVDVAGGLRVGPQSAGAMPGPACYGQGGELPTVTDANLLLGYLPARELADGSLELSGSLAEAAVQKHVAAPAGLEIAEAAWAIHRVAVASMANAARVVSIRRGIDVRDYALFPCGGAGPMHACEIADELGISTVVLPPVPGVLAAYGLLAADIKTNHWRTSQTTLSDESLRRLHRQLVSGVESAQAETKAKGEYGGVLNTQISLDIRYIGQAHELDVVIEADDLLRDDAADFLRRAFDDLHMERYGQFDKDSACEITGYKVAVTGTREVPAPGFELTSVDSRSAETTRFYDPTRSEYLDAAVIRRSDLHGPLSGPAVVEQPDTTIVIQRGWRAVPAAHGALHLVKEDTAEAITE